MNRVGITFLLCVVGAWWSPLAGDEPFRLRLPDAIRKLFSETQEGPSHPIVIRVHETAFGSAAGEDIDSLGPVRMVILGTPVTGASRTLGKVHVDASANDACAAFLVSFAGKCYSNTVGRNGPAQVYNHSETDFVVTRRVTFSPLAGFDSEKTAIRSTTKVTLDDVRSTRRGLVGRVVRRVAWRRARENHAAAEAIAARNTRQELFEGFDRLLDVRVAELNKQANLARYLNGILGEETKFNVVVNSTDDCVQFAVGRVGAQGTSETIPVDSQPPAPLEIWVHSSALGDRLPRLADAYSLVTSPASPMAASLPMLQAMAWQADDASDAVGIRLRKNWVVLSIDPKQSDDAAKSSQQLARMRPASSDARR